MCYIHKQYSVLVSIRIVQTQSKVLSDSQFLAYKIIKLTNIYIHRERERERERDRDRDRERERERNVNVWSKLHLQVLEI